MADQSIDMNTQNVQSGRAGGGPTSGASISKAMENAPSNIVGLMNSLSLRPREVATLVVVEPIAKAATEIGGRAASGLFSRLLRIFGALFPKI